MQGYQIIAFGPARYRNMAAACAASIRYWDKKRPVQLITDRSEFAGGYRKDLFDIISADDFAGPLRGPMVKLLSARYSPFEETMFIDADCLMLKDDIDFWWSLAREKDFAIPGTWESQGPWYGMEIARMCALAGTARLVKMNSGSFYHKNNERARAVFDLAARLFQSLGNFSGHIHNGSAPPDEPFLALALGLLNIDPLPVHNAAGRAWMLSTLGCAEFHCEALSGAVSLNKSPGGAPLSPSICHFIDKRPLRDYLEQSGAYLNAWRRNAGHRASPH